MAADGEPGELEEIGSRLAIPKHPSVGSPRMEAIPVLGLLPAPRLVWMLPFDPPYLATKHPGVQRAKGLRGNSDPEVHGFTSDDRVEAVEHRRHGCTTEMEPFPPELGMDTLDRGLAG